MTSREELFAQVVGKARENLDVWQRLALDVVEDVFDRTRDLLDEAERQVAEGGEVKFTWPTDKVWPKAKATGAEGPQAPKATAKGARRAPEVGVMVDDLVKHYTGTQQNLANYFKHLGGQVEAVPGLKSILESAWRDRVPDEKKTWGEGYSPL